MHRQIQKSEDGSRGKEARGQRSEVSDSISTFCLLLAALLLVGGCSKSPTSDLRSPSAGPASPTPWASNSVLRVHWAGKQTLGIDASAYSFMRLWNLPESKQVEAQLLQKLYTAPWRSSAGQAAPANDASAALQPLLDDVLNQEGCLEIRAASGQSEQWVYAFRANSARAAIWQLNLAEVLSSTEGAYPSKRGSGWMLQSPRTGQSYELERTGDWIVCGISAGTNALFREIVDRIQREQVPFTLTTNAHWLAVEVDLGWVMGQRTEVKGQKSAGPRITLLVTGDGANTLVTGDVTFAQPLQLNLEPWNFPQGQMTGPVVGFSAVRGIGPWLAQTNAWTNGKLGSAPNQIFTWAEARAPLQMHLAAPAPTARETTHALGDTFARHVNGWLAEHALGSVAPWPDASAAVWKDLPMIAPYLTSTNPGWLQGGTSPSALPDAKPPEIYPRPTREELFTTVASRTNLVAYQWETTGSRAESVHILGQILRAVFRHPQIPANTGSAQWLQAARNRLGNCTTVVTLTAPNKLAFERKSTTGFSAFELHVIADWMESPDFPRGFYSTLSPVGPALQPAGK